MSHKTYKEVVKELKTYSLSVIGIDYESEAEEDDSDFEYDPYYSVEDSKLFFESCDNGDLDTAKEIVSKNVDIVNSYDPIKKNMALHQAVKNKNLKIAKFLLDNRADNDCYDAESMSPIEYAVESNNIDMVKLILQYGVVHLDECIEYCVYNGYEDIIEVLTCDERVGYNGIYAINLACRLRYLDLLILILRCLLVYNDDEDISEMLCDRINTIVNHSDCTYDCITLETLISVCVLCRPEIVELLIGIENIYIGRYYLNSFIIKCKKELEILSSISIGNKSLTYILTNYKYNDIMLIRKHKYILSVSYDFVIYGYLIRERVKKLLVNYNNIYESIDCLCNILPPEIISIIVDKVYNDRLN